MKKCFLFTSCYPYGFGETFLETEMPFLADRFDQIIIFSLTSNKTIVRKVPDNVLYFSLNQTNYPFKKIRKLFSGFFHNPFPIDRKKIKDRIHCYYKRGTVYRATRKCVSIIKKHNFTLDSNTVFYSYWLSDTALISLLLRKILHANVKCVSRAHGSDVYSYAQPCGFNPFQEYIISNLDYVFTVSENGKEYLSSLYQNYSSKIFTQRLGTKDCGVGKIPYSSNIHFVTCSNIIDIKRVDLFARLFCELSKKSKNLFWTCFGDGDQLNYIKQLVQHNCLDEHVTFMGRQTNEFVMSYYKSNSVSFFVNLSITEGLPVSIMEAMSFGIPCLATSVGGTNELVDNTNGLLLTPNEGDNYYFDMILTAINTNGNDYLTMRKNARKKWETLCNADLNYLNWCEILRGIIND